MLKYTLLLLMIPLFIFSQIPETINYQGKLNDNSGNPVSDDDYTVIFTIFDEVTNGNSLWTETRTITTIGGFFNLTLGENSPINISTTDQLWLNINVEGTDLTPRSKLSGSLSSISTKTIESTLSAGNSVVASINASEGGISTIKIGDGDIDDTELSYLDDASGNIQNQLDGKQPTLPTITGNDDKYLYTDGTNLSWEAVSSSGGGSSLTTSEMTVSSDITINSETYMDVTNTVSCDANSIYLIKGIIGLDRLGSNSKVKVKLEYSDTYDINYLSINGANVGAEGEIASFAINSNPDANTFDGFIKTTNAGDLSLQVAKATGADNSTLFDFTKLIVIKIK